jgi:hydrogenase expression/formation protein HypC
MQVVKSHGLMATCKGSGRTEDVNLALIGEMPEGTHLLVYLGSAVRILDPVEAAQITDAIGAIEAAAQGHDFEHLIQDLIDREPELPEHLRPQGATPAAASGENSPEPHPSPSLSERGSGKDSPEPGPSLSEAERESNRKWEENHGTSTAESPA